MFGKGKPRSLVGLDIGSSAVKAVELKSAGEGFELIAFGLHPLAQNAVVDSAIVDKGGVVEAITQALAQQKIKTRSVATSVAGHSLIVKRVTLAPMSHEELAERIHTEAAQHIPFDMADVNLSYEVLLNESNERQTDVLLVAAKKDKIELHMNVVSEAGADTEIVDIDAFALQNCFEMNYAPDPAETLALLDIGASVMNIAVTRGGQPLFVRDVSIGGNQYTDALQKQFGVGFEEGEKLKRSEELGAAAQQREAALRSVSQTVILEIQKTLDFCRASSRKDIERIYVAGGSARVPGLLPFLHDEFSIPVEEIDPFRKIQIDPGRHREQELRASAPRFAIAVGLALRSFDSP